MHFKVLKIKKDENADSPIPGKEDALNRDISQPCKSIYKGAKNIYIRRKTMAKTEKTFFADFYEGGQKSVIVLEDNVNYQFKLFLDTPYKWGAGFKGSSENRSEEHTSEL